MHESANGHLGRRQALKFGAALLAATGGWAAGHTRDAVAQADAERRPEGVIDAASGFAVIVPACPEASKHIRDVQIDPLTVESRETTTGLDVEYRLFAPGATHWGQATFTSAVMLGGSKELKAWFDECAQGKDLRKTITVTLLTKDKQPARSYVLYDCLPTQWSAVALDASATGQAEQLKVKIGRIEFKV